MKFTTDDLMEFVEDLDPKLDRHKTDLICNCPECGKREFGISLNENHPFNCWRKKHCGLTGNIYTLASILGKKIKVDISFDETKKLESIISMNSGTKEEYVPPSIKEIILPVGYKRLGQHPYLHERGFTELDYDFHEVGYTRLHSKLKNYVIFPIKEEGLNVGYVARSVLSKEAITEYKNNGINILRYRNSDYTDFEALLYGYNELSEKVKTIIIVEGIFDKINVDRLLDLQNNESMKCVATFKCNVSPDQIYKIQKYKIRNVILLYDNDVIKNIKKNGIELSKYFDTKIAINKSKNDPGDMNFDELSETLNSVTNAYTFNNQYIANFTLKM